jgi:hypothetical protein
VTSVRQHIARCLVVLFPLATYSQITAILLRGYLRVLEANAEEGEACFVHEDLLQQVAVAVCQDPTASFPRLATWVDAQSAKCGLGLLSDYSEEDKSRETVLAQVSNVLDLFEVEREGALETRVLEQVLEYCMA